MRLWTLIRALTALLLLTPAIPAWAQTLTLNGTVTYRERIALPRDAWLRVTLVELESGAPVVGASAIIPARGAVPLAFTLNIRSTLEAETAYGLMAEISQAGRVLFRNPVPVQVTPGRAEAPSILVNFAPQPAEPPVPPMAPMPPAPPSDLLEMVWSVTSISGRPISAGRPLTLSIAADHRAGGSGGCNNYFTEASIADNAIVFGPAAATRMACDPEIMSQEADYFAALAAVASYELDEQGLRLRDAAGVPLIGLVRTTE